MNKFSLVLVVIYCLVGCSEIEDPTSALDTSTNVSSTTLTSSSVNVTTNESDVMSSIVEDNLSSDIDATPSNTNAELSSSANIDLSADVMSSIVEGMLSSDFDTTSSNIDVVLSSNSTTIDLSGVTVQSPVNGEILTDTEVDLTWANSVTDSLVVLIGTTNPPTIEYTVASGESSVHIDSLMFGTKYYWQLETVEGMDATKSSMFSFSVAEESIQSVVSRIRQATYIIGFNINDKIIGIGSGFAINDIEIMTNAHVVNGLIDMIKEYGMEDGEIIAVRDGGTLTGDQTFVLDSFKVHTSYDSTTNHTYDFGVLKIKDGSIIKTVSIKDDLGNALFVGDEIITIGFPGETNSLNYTSPIATFKTCNISALRPFDSEENVSADKTVIQHDCNTTGGTSGSPLFNRKGEVIGIHNSGEYDFILGADGEYTRIPVGSQSYGIRYDKASSLFEQPYNSFKSVIPEFVTYTFINGTLSDMEMYVNGNVYDTIRYLDTLQLMEYKGVPVELPIEFKSIVLTDNYLMWVDTMYTGIDFEKEYYASNDYFLLSLTLEEKFGYYTVSVLNGYSYSDSIYWGGAYFVDVGYYRSGTSTDIYLTESLTGDVWSWEDRNTVSLNQYALYYPLTAQGSLTVATLGKVAIVNNEKEVGTKRTYFLSEFLDKKRSK